MVILLGHKFPKLYSKLENHNHHHHNHHHHDHHHDSHELSASLKAFRAEVSNLINEIASDSKHGSEILSLFWIQKCLGILPLINKAFTKFTLEIDYPMSKWEVDSIEEYLNYSLCLLELFNSISSSLSHLEKAKLSLIHNLKLIFENSQSLATSHHHLKAIQPSCLKTKFGEELCEKSHKVRFLKGKELIVNEAVNEMKIIGFWVCGILLSGLCSDVKPYIEVKKMLNGFDGSSIYTIDSKISEGLDEKKLMLKEVKDVNDAVDYLLVASDEVKNDAAKELEIKVNKFVKVFDGVKAEVDDLFSKVMALRSELIDQLRKLC